MPDRNRMDAAFGALPDGLRRARPSCGLILGSGWSRSVPQRFQTLQACEYDAIPGLGAGRVPGHDPRLLLVADGDFSVLVFCGRRHWYECCDWTPVAIPLEICRRLEVTSLWITNAAGGVRPDLAPGDLMLIRDHVNLMGLNPLQGPRHPGWGARFPDQSEVYDRELCARLRRSAVQADLSLAEGVYAFTGGPNFETPAEVRALAAQGIDAVGMSTVPESMLAAAMGMRVVAVSCITNMAAGIHGPHLSHDEVLEQSRRALPRMRRLIDACLTPAGFARSAGPDREDRAARRPAG